MHLDSAMRFRNCICVNPIFMQYAISVCSYACHTPPNKTVSIQKYTFKI